MTLRLFQEGLDELKQKILSMAGLTEKALDNTARALLHRDADLARLVVEMDDQIDQYEVAIDRQATELIARHQPMATDLRFVIVAIKLGPEIERIADNAVNIARAVIDLDEQPVAKPLLELPRMLALARAMVADAIAAYVARDPRQAWDVIHRDDDVDDLYWEIVRGLLTSMIEQPETITRSISLVLVARYAERIADQATNIAEEVIYLVDGEPVRHSPRVAPHLAGERAVENEELPVEEDDGA
jgi:phosphate transport system protein